MSPKPALLSAIALLVLAPLPGCGLKYSDDHFTAQGTIVPPPARLPLVPAVPGPDDVVGPKRPVPAGLPALTAAYREVLIEMAHPFPPELAQQFADAEIAALQRQYAGRDAELSADLARRLNPPPTRPAPPRRTPDAFYPPDEAPSPTERRVP